MKKFTLLGAALVAAMGANAQIMIDWNDEGQFVFHAEDFIAEGSIAWDEDEAAFVCNGTGEGKIMLNLDGKTIDFSEVASIKVTGSYQLEGADDSVNLVGGWGAEGTADPLATLLINDAISGKINEWFGSRYDINYKGIQDKGEFVGEPYYSLSTKIDAFYFTARTITEGEGDDAVITGSVPGYIYLDEVVLTKIKEQDPKAVAPLFHRWTNWDATGEIDETQTVAFDDNVGKNLGVGGVVLGTGSVLGCDYADLTGYAGIYIKGTPGMTLRLLFNRPDMEGGSAPISECQPTCDENGEYSFMFSELTNAEIEKFGEAYPYVHLNAVKIPWGLPEGVESVKVQKFNFIEKGEGDSVNSVNAAKDADVIYNVFGQRVDESYRGIVIKNGKKFINK